MLRRFALVLTGLLAGLLALAGCDRPGPADSGEAAPLLYEVRDASDKTAGWLFGTIHALPDGTRWRTPQLEDAIGRAGVLVVEIAALEDNQALAQTFAELATTPGLPDIAERIPAAERPALFDLISRSDYQASDFGSVETWAAALMLAQVDSDGRSANGTDRALLRAFAGRPVTEFEGARQQLSIFDSLPENEQADLLVGMLHESRLRSADPARLRRAWLAGDAAVLEQAMDEGILSDPELRSALLTARNRAWGARLAAMLENGERPLVAVGTAHLLGPDGLAAMLEQRGYKVTRLH